MKNTPENKILTSSEIGALSPRVPRQSEALIDVPKPKEARLFLEDGTEITYLPEASGDITPGTPFIKKGDRAKKKWVFRGRATDGNIVLEQEGGEGVLVSLRDFEAGYKKSRKVYVEKTREGKEIKLDTEEILKESTQFYATHNLREFSDKLPREIKISAAGEARIREALKEGFDKAMILPSSEIQKGNIDKLLGEMADKPFPGLLETDQYTAYYMYEPDTTKNATPRNRPAKKAYLVLYQSGSIPPETRGKTPPQLDQLFTQKKWDGLTLEEYLIIQRKELETRKNHGFDAYFDTAAQSQWTWLLDSRVPEGVVRACWYPRFRQVEVYWYGPEVSYGELGARPVVVVEIEV